MKILLEYSRFWRLHLKSFVFLLLLLQLKLLKVNSFTNHPNSWSHYSDRSSLSSKRQISDIFFGSKSRSFNTYSRLYSTIPKIKKKRVGEINEEFYNLANKWLGKMNQKAQTPEELSNFFNEKDIEEADHLHDGEEEDDHDEISRENAKLLAEKKKKAAGSLDGRNKDALNGKYNILKKEEIIDKTSVLFNEHDDEEEKMFIKKRKDREAQFVFNTTSINADGSINKEEIDKEKEEASPHRFKLGLTYVESGDFLVHRDYGYCKYIRMLLRKDKNGQPVRVYVIEFATGEEIFTQNQLRDFSRYKDAGSLNVKLGKYNHTGYLSWMKKKEKVRTKARDYAINILALYAQREEITRPPCQEDDQNFIKFENQFAFEPTKDQVKAFIDIQKDMVWRKRPMDRLICGDVGFGKTEVAMRAVYRAVQNNRQVAILAPTAILAAQHVNTLQKRMPDVKVELVRGGKKKGWKVLKESIENGDVEVVVGTHAIISGTYGFKNLGLVVVDEEQRFGVNQKEKLKVMSNGVDVLTLSATPIPRTLQMGLCGIRDMTTITSPPTMRKNVTTIVTRAKAEVIKTAIDRELERDGQVFYVVPRIQNVEPAYKLLQVLAPNARISIAHSKIPKVEDVVLDFTLGNADILIATSLIENGIDIPNVNTVIVPQANSFGVSSLYQLRGRVGRSNKDAYAYFLYPSAKTITSDAVQRLAALKQYSTLGSGFDLAKTDLAIRGAGSIMGVDQSGDIDDIGYELYMEILQNTIQDIRGAAVEPVPHCELKIQNLKRGEISKNYMGPNKALKNKELEILRVTRSFNEWKEVANSWQSKYGPLPSGVKRLLLVQHLLIAAQLLSIESIHEVKKREMEEKLKIIRQVQEANIKAEEQSRLGPKILVPHEQEPEEYYDFEEEEDTFKKDEQVSYETTERKANVNCGDEGYIEDEDANQRQSMMKEQEKELERIKNLEQKLMSKTEASEKKKGITRLKPNDNCSDDNYQILELRVKGIAPTNWKVLSRQRTDGFDMDVTYFPVPEGGGIITIQNREHLEPVELLLSVLLPMATFVSSKQQSLLASLEQAGIK